MEIIGQEDALYYESFFKHLDSKGHQKFGNQKENQNNTLGNRYTGSVYALPVWSQASLGILAKPLISFINLSSSNN